MAEFQVIYTACGDISKRLDKIHRASAKIVYHMQRCSAWYKNHPRVRKWWAAACLAVTIFAALQVWRTGPTPVRQTQRNNDGLSSDQQPVREDRREIVTERTGSPVTHLLCQMSGLYPHEVLWVRNTVSAWFSGVGWGNLAWWWWS